MIIEIFEQGTEEWHKARSGIPTASGFSSIITPTGKASTSARGYMGELLAEWLLINNGDQFSSEWMDRGIFIEPESRSAYEFIKEIEVEQVGLILRDDRMVAASPDGLIGKGGGLEIKCPKASTHMSYLIDGELPKEYKAQVQGNLWISERDWWDFMSYHPAIKPFILRVHRDEKFIKILSDLMDAFVDRLLEAREKFKAAA